MQLVSTGRQHLNAEYPPCVFLFLPSSPSVLFLSSILTFSSHQHLSVKVPRSVYWSHRRSLTFNNSPTGWCACVTSDALTRCSAAPSGAPLPLSPCVEKKVWGGLPHIQSLTKTRCAERREFSVCVSSPEPYDCHIAPWVICGAPHSPVNYPVRKRRETAVEQIEGAEGQREESAEESITTGSWLTYDI